FKLQTMYTRQSAPDSEGPTLVMTREKYGEGDPRAWAASDKVGGSPGAAEPIGGGGRNVLINEILAHTENPAVPDFVELYNHGNQPVDLSGALITDGDTNSFRISNGTIIPANGFLSFDQNQLEFAFKAAGDRVFLISSNQTRVLDAVRFDAQANAVSIGRLPDGAETFRELAYPTPGARNGDAGLKSRDIVINE